MLRTRIADAAAAVGLECRADPHDVGVLRLWADVPQADLQHDRRDPGSRCRLCGVGPKADEICEALPTQRLVGLVVIRDEAITYAEIGARRFGSLGRSAIATLDVVLEISEITS